MSSVPSSLATLTTMRVGGPAERILVARSRDELVQHSLDLWSQGEDWLLLGGGSNSVISDEGFPGTVLLVRSEGIEVVDDFSLAEDAVRVRVQAGHDWDGFVATCVSRGWGGVESLSGIPGLVGAAPIQNIGAYGSELSDTLHSVEFLDASTEKIVRLAAADLQLGYRDSALKRRELEGVVLSVDFVLSAREDNGPGTSAPVRYDQLAHALEVNLGDVVNPRRVREAVLQLRAAKGMVLDVSDHDTWSSGSFFTNPIVSQHFARSLPDAAPKYPVEAIEGETIVIPLEELQETVNLPSYLPGPTPQRRVKLSAAWLIEQSGIRKGFQLPGSGAAISSKHTLAITNRGNASSADVAELARYVISLVRSEFGVVLSPEPQLYGLEL